MTYLIPVLFAASGLLGAQCLNWTYWQTVCEGKPANFYFPMVFLRPGERVAQSIFSKKGQGIISTDSDPRFNPSPLALNWVTFSDAGEYSIVVDIATAEGTVRNYINTFFIMVPRIPVLNDDGKMHIWPSGKKKVTIRGVQTLFLKLSCGSFEDRGDPPVVVEWKEPDGNVSPSSYKFFANKTYNVWLRAPVTPGLYQCYIHPESIALGCLSPDSLLKLKDGAFFNLTEDVIRNISRARPFSRQHVSYSARESKRRYGRSDAASLGDAAAVDPRTIAYCVKSQAQP